MGCARCHDHKYDPLPQQDFYNLFAVFNNVPENGKDGRNGAAVPILNYENPETTARLAELAKRESRIENELRVAAASASAERLLWEEKLREHLADARTPTWSRLVPHSVTSSKGLEFEALPDGSYLRRGANPANPAYTITLGPKSLAGFADRALTGLKLEALVHDSLTAKSLAPSVNGNFVLTDVALRVRRNDETTPLPFSRAIADYAQENYPAARTIDGDPKSGWAVDGHMKKETRTILFQLREPYSFEETDTLELVLRHDSQFARHAIGRFRLSATTSPTPSLDGKPGLPAAVVAGLTADEPTAAQHAAVDEHFRETHPSFAAIRKRREPLNQDRAAIEKQRFVKVMVMSEMPQPRKTFVLDRGQYDLPDETRPATPDIPVVFGGLGEAFPRNRLGFARWLVADTNPLTARVTVNRFWQRYFGRGLVETVEDFGSQGTPPSHPDLLDWLAVEFREGWDVKAMQRLIVTSGTYRQASRLQQAHIERDPDNVLLARAPRIRLSGYQLRDQALAAGGLLSDRIGGPSVKPYQPPGLWAEVSFQSKGRSTDFYVRDSGEKLYRRGLYTFWKRSVAPPMLANFDAAGREACVVRATRTNTPLQALNLMNDVTFVEASRAVGQRMLSEGGDTTDPRLRHGLQLLGVAERPATLAVLTKGHAAYHEHFTAHPEAAADYLDNGEWEHDPSLDPVDLAAMAATASVILNLDETIVRE